MAFSTVLLDLDGTITNPYMGITNGVMYAYPMTADNGYFLYYNK